MGNNGSSTLSTSVIIVDLNSLQVEGRYSKKNFNYW